MDSIVPEISVVVPVFNEAPNLQELYTRIVAALDALDRDFEVLMVDDGSSDGSYEILLSLQSADPRLRIIRLARNFGQTPALYAGFAHVRGRVILQLDADLQNPPEELVKLIEKLEEGYDVVQGWREQRHDVGYRRLASKILNWFISFMTKVKIRDLGCGLKAYRREVIDHLSLFSHRSRYLPADLMWLGASIAEVKVAHRERAAGEGKYGLWKLLCLNFDMVSSVTTAPIKLVGIFGFMLLVLGALMGALVLAIHLAYGGYPLFLSVMTFFFLMAGLQLTALGLLCEYISRIFIEAQNKPYYIVREVRDGEKAP